MTRDTSGPGVNPSVRDLLDKYSVQLRFDDDALDEYHFQQVYPVTGQSMNATYRDLLLSLENTIKEDANLGRRPRYYLRDQLERVEVIREILARAGVLDKVPHR